MEKEIVKFEDLNISENIKKALKDIGYTTDLRSTHEPIKHKILDLLGDLYLTGVSPLNLRAQILVKEAGHAVHCKVAQQLKNKLVKI